MSNQEETAPDADKLKRLLQLALDKSASDGEIVNAVKAASKIVGQLGGYDAALAAIGASQPRSQPYRPQGTSPFASGHGGTFRGGFNSWGDWFSADDIKREAERFAKKDREAKAAAAERERQERAAAEELAQARREQEEKLKAAMQRGDNVKEALRRSKIYVPEDLKDEWKEYINGTVSVLDQLDQMAAFAAQLRKARAKR